jgi:hypothetical protein
MKWIGWNALLLVVAAGCAGADIYLDKELKQKTGLPIYVARPYLLVKYTGNTTAPVGVEIVYLPDLERPVYAKQRVGVGKAKMVVKMTDGRLTEFSTEADSRATEFAGALTAGLKTIAEAIKIQRETELLDDARRDQDDRRLAAADLEAVADEMSRADAERAKFDVQRTAADLREEARRLRDPAWRGDEAQVIAALEEKLADLTKRGAPAAWTDGLRRAISRLRRVATRAVRQATFELYEIRMKEGETSIARVKIPPG